MANRPARQFARLLTEAVYRIRYLESKSIQAVQDELGYALGKTGGSSIEYWRKGNIPADPAELAALARALVKRAGVDRVWLNQFLQYADYSLREPNRITTLSTSTLPSSFASCFTSLQAIVLDM